MDIYPFDILVSIAQTDDQLGAILDKYHLKKKDIRLAQYTSTTAQGRAAMFSSNQSFIRLRKLPSTPEEFGTLAHEIFHIATFILNRIGMKLQILVSDEAYSYLIGYITKRFYSETNKYY